MFIAARRGQRERVANRLAAISGEVLMKDEEIDLLRARIPIDRVHEVAAWDEVTVAQVDAGDEAALFAVDGRPETQDATYTLSKPGVPPSAYTSRDNPYTAERATQSLQLKTENPTYDGRGVVIGGIEPVDVRTPSLRRAFSLQGNLIPKFADYVMSVPPRVTTGAIPQKGETDYGWQQTVIVHPDLAERVSFNGKRYLIPESVRLDELRMAIVRARASRPISRLIPGISSEMTILWAVKAEKAWLCEGDVTDFHQGLAFEALPMLPHRPALAQTRNGDKRTFMLAVDLPLRAIRLRYGPLYHGTMGASTATGHTFLNSEAEGVAPGAQYLPVDFGSGRDQTTMQLPALSDLFRDPRVDLVTNSSGMGDARRFSDQGNVYRECLDRLGERYSKVMFKSAGNLGPDGLKELGFNKSDTVITVGAYTPLEAWETNFGITPTNPVTPPSYTSYGPSSDGGLEPDLLSLTGILSAAKPAPSLSVFGASPFYDMPPGYGLTGGTSAATPNAAGHTALLISAAKQQGIPFDLKRLKIALFSSCLFLDGVEARVQGHGLIQISDAWQVLRKLKDHAVSTFTTEAPVRTYHSSELMKPNIGRGLYERIGWAAGQIGEREISITRTSGPDHPITYQLRWLEARRPNNASDVTPRVFSSPLTQVTLPLNRSIRIPIRIQVRESGAYSAIMDLIDRNEGVVVHSVMCTIVVAEQLTAQNGYTATIKRAAPHPGNGLAFVNVPPGTAALRVQLKQENGRLVTLNVQRPDGGKPKVNLEPDFVPAEWRLRPSARRTYDQTFADPQPGVWQFWVDHENGFIDSYDPTLPRPAPACEFTITVSAIGGQWHTTREPSNSQIKVKFNGQFAKIATPQVVALGLGAMNERETVLPTGLPSVFYEVHVTSGTTKLRASANAETESATNVSLIVFRISDENPKLSTRVAFDIGVGPHKEVELINPKPGRYKICLDAWGRGLTKSLRVRYREELYGPQYGRLAVTGELAKSDEIVQASISWQAQGKAINQSHLVAEVALVSDDCVNMSDANTKAKAGKPSVDVTAEPVPIATTTIILPRNKGYLSQE